LVDPRGSRIRVDDAVDAVDVSTRRVDVPADASSARWRARGRAAPTRRV